LPILFERFLTMMRAELFCVTRNGKKVMNAKNADIRKM